MSELNQTQKDRESAKQDVKMYMANDWEIKEETPEYFLLKKNEATLTSHLVIFVFVGWWTLGLANLVYHLANRKTKKIVK